MLQQGAFKFLYPANVLGTALLTFLEQKGMLKWYHSNRTRTEVANEYTKYVTARLAWVNLGVNNAEKMRV